MKKHEQTKHEEKAHSCKYCNSKFARNYVKNSHELKCENNRVKPKKIPNINLFNVEEDKSKNVKNIVHWYEIKIMYVPFVHF